MNLQSKLESSTCKDAYQTIIQLGHPRDRNGFLIAKRMADVYGKRDWFDILCPVRSEWGEPGASLIEDWSLYKSEVDGRFCDTVFKRILSADHRYGSERIQIISLPHQIN